ncbi:unnamed protein product [Anisakis simplex]|uniref:Uncharacterized protein n=1 Tax=Anisakis simplex TaxID=6269 RepID=A0A0M3JW17_ANISI|nr:unnamed protein product [Anisakis simplex]
MREPFMGQKTDAGKMWRTYGGPHSILRSACGSVIVKITHTWRAYGELQSIRGQFESSQRFPIGVSRITSFAIK